MNQWRQEHGLTVIGAEPYLRAPCWCGNHLTWVARRLIVAGRTFSCGPHCHPDTQLSEEEGAA